MSDQSETNYYICYKWKHLRVDVLGISDATFYKWPAKHSTFVNITYYNLYKMGIEA